ncbi:major facilitator superfamily transporter [Myriangium duriaei CBS 260.36]|uniref:Major facilitator superfamily transporter n=1 Tax=Myriangium duriaei CBS 260.36 TaxID=1168546 RepID=A0A9P4J346_9PEZI|nr:major facilitator superfamily transporter [Myriangium duriaei CBS 260.36]
MSLKRAFALSKQELASECPPGTTGHHEHNEQHIHLQPEPSSDPADPLNFSMTRKTIILMLMSGYALVTNISSSVLSSALPNLVTAFATFSQHGPPVGIVPFSDLTHLIAVNNLMLGISNILIVPLSNTFGRRPIILLCLAILFASSIWCAEATSFHSLLAGRVIQGVGGAAADTLAPDVIGRTFFVHERGRVLALYTVCLTGGSLIGGVIGGYITASLGWQWTMWLSAILSGAILVLSIFFLPETLYDRIYESNTTTMTPGQGDSRKEYGSVAHEERVEHHHRPYTFTRSLGFMAPRSGLLRRFIQPWTTVIFPGTIMVMLHYSGLVGLIVTISTLSPQLLAEPPYLWGENVGLINVAGLIGCALGGLYTYFTADWIIKRGAKHASNGLTEPERRLPLMFPALFISTAGALVYGFSAQYPAPNRWAGLAAGYGMVAFGLMQVPSIGFNYIIESYGEWASDCFVIVVALRAVISFAWTFFIGSWTAKTGPSEPMGIFGLLMGLFSLTTIPVWLFGKRLRIATASIVNRARLD